MSKINFTKKKILVPFFAVTFLIALFLTSYKAVAQQLPTVPPGYTIRVAATGGLLSGQQLLGIVGDLRTGNVYVATDTVGPSMYYPYFDLYRITPAGVVTLVGIYPFGHDAIEKMAFGPDNKIYVLDINTYNVMTIDPVTGLFSIYANVATAAGGTRYGLAFDSTGSLILGFEPLSSFYRVTPSGPVFLGNVTASVPNNGHGDAFGIQPNGNYAVYSDVCNPPMYNYSINTAGHADSTDYTSLAWVGTTDLHTIYNPADSTTGNLCYYSTGAIDPITGDVYSITSNFGRGITSIAFTPAAGGASSPFVTRAGNGSDTSYTEQGITDLTFAKASSGCGNSLYFVDNYQNTVYEVQKKDTTAPVVTCPPSQVFCYDSTGMYTIPALTASDNCGVDSIHYIITGATNRSDTGSNASGKFNQGVSTITFIVRDFSGNQSSCQTTVTIGSKITVHIPDTKALRKGVEENTVYPGYAPASSLTLTANVSGGTPPYKYQWSNGATTRSIRVSPKTNTFYRVVVTDKNKCTGLDSERVEVEDVRCDENRNKVEVCKNNRTLCVTAKEVEDYLDYGAYLGDCKASRTTSNIESSTSTEEAPLNALIVKAAPNPSRSSFTLFINSANLNEGVIIKVTDALGRIIEVRNAGRSQSVQLGALYRAGMYYVEVIQGKERVTVKLVKQAQ